MWAIFLIIAVCILVWILSKAFASLKEPTQSSISQNKEIAWEFYKSCIDSIGLLNSIANSEEFRLFASGKGYSLEAGRELFQLGQEVDKIKCEEIYAKRIEEKHSVFYEQKEKAESVSRNIYLKPVQEKYEMVKKWDELVNSAYDLGRDVFKNAHANKSNPALWGGIANGLGGIGAGLTTAYEVQKQNEKSEAFADNQRRSGLNVSRVSFSKADVFRQPRNQLENLINSIYCAHMDNSNQQDKVNNIRFKVNEYLVKKYGLMDIKVSTNYAKYYDNLASPLFTKIADGSVRIIITKDDDVVGEAYISNDYSYDEVASGSDKLGFKKNYVVTGKALNGEFEVGCKYSFKFEPINVWYIDKFKKCEDIDFEKLRKDFSEVSMAVQGIPYHY